MIGKVIAITGGASGIGLATARLLASRGAILSLCDINASNLASALTSLQGSKHMATVVDVGKSSEVNTWIDRTIENLGQLDGAANIAGIGPRMKGIRDITDEDFDLVSKINVNGVFYALRAELKNMNNGGAIVSCNLSLAVFDYFCFIIGLLLAA